MRTFSLIIIIAAFLLVFTNGIQAQTTRQEKRIALIIGNGNYTASILANPENDARAIADALHKLGFTVNKYENLDQIQMKKVIDDFGLKLKGNDIGLFYYAGHGIQAQGYNYLIPVDAQLKTEEQVGDYSGTYTYNAPTGQVITLVLKANENEAYSGTISDNSYSYKVTGQVQNGLLNGYYGEGAGAVNFTAQIQNELLTFTVATRDYLGNVNPLVMNFVRSGVSVSDNAAKTSDIIINNIVLSREQMQEIKNRYGVEPRPGNYWYDSSSGLYGVTGFPSYGFMYPGHNFGALSRNASAGNTGVVINGRELPQLEWAVWSYILGYYIQPGNYWLDSQGNAGYVGNNIPVVNLFVAARQNAYSGQGGGGDNFWSTRFSAGNSNADNTQGYVSVPGYGPVGYGF